MKKIIAFLLIVLSITGISVGIYSFYLLQMSRQLVEGWMRIEQMSIQQGNLFSALASSHRILMASGTIKSVMLFDVQNNSMEEMASYGEYLALKSLPDMQPGDIKTKISGLYDVTTFVRFQERPNLMAVFRTTSPQTGILFLVMLGLILIVVIGFSIYLQKIARDEEARRFSIIEDTVESLLSDSASIPTSLSQTGDSLSHWNAIQKNFEKLKEKLEVAARDRILARTSQMLGHDLRAPLGTFEKLLYIKEHEFPAMKDLIRTSLNRLNSMIESLRHSEFETVVQRKPTKLDLNYGLETIKMMADQKGITINVDHTNDGPFQIDAPKIERAWMNIAFNALEFSKSYITIATSIDTHELLIKISDDGPGVDESVLPRLFQRGATARKSGGTGLGLAYAKVVAQGHGGDVEYLRKNEISSFIIRLPHSLNIEFTQSSKEAQQSPNPTEKVIRVALCCLPTEFNQQCLKYLAADSRSPYEFSTEFDESNIVVCNNIETLTQAIESGKK